MKEVYAECIALLDELQKKIGDIYDTTDMKVREWMILKNSMENIEYMLEIREDSE